MILCTAMTWAIAAACLAAIATTAAAHAKMARQSVVVKDPRIVGWGKLVPQVMSTFNLLNRGFDCHVGE
jgi:ABC-type enterobactin transport system permease subunit